LGASALGAFAFGIYKPTEKIFAAFSAVPKLKAQAITFTLRHPKQ
jgi:hypothetical protein